VTPAVSTTVDAAALRLAVMRLARRLRQEADAGITQSQLSALATLQRLGPLPLRELAAAERVGSSTLTRIVAALEDQGLLGRTNDPTDRRVALVSVTAAGARMLSDVRERGTQLLAERLATLPGDAAATLAAALPVLEHLIAEQR
jgi:DNA-binding MarR family transcriptional regulator